MAQILTGFDKALTWSFKVASGVSFNKGDRYSLNADGEAIKPTATTDKTLGTVVEDRDGGKYISGTVPGIVKSAIMDSNVTVLQHLGLGATPNCASRYQGITVNVAGATETQAVAIALKSATSGSEIDICEYQTPVPVITT